MAIRSRRVGGNNDFPIYRLTETCADGTLAIWFAGHGQTMSPACKVHLT
jgi:hypothetical protein